jgi:hypothetical protein
MQNNAGTMDFLSGALFGAAMGFSVATLLGGMFAGPVVPLYRMPNKTETPLEMWNNSAAAEPSGDSANK